MFSMKYYEYQEPVVFVVGLIFFNFNLWLWGHFSFYLNLEEPVWTRHAVLKSKKVFGKYELQSFCHVLSVMKEYLCYYVLKVFRETNERSEQV